MSRIFSKNTYNGFHMLSLSDEPNTVLLFGKKATTKDTEGFEVAEYVDPEKECRTDYMARRLRPWEPFIYVPSTCQRCRWLYRTPGNEFSCILFDKKKSIRPQALVNGSA